MAIKLLKRVVANKRLAHTYLFYGPQGVGKEFAAREFAKVLNCSEKKDDGCDVCSACKRIAQNKHPDVLWIYPGGKSRVIKIEQVRQMQDFVAWRPYEGRKKVCVLVDAHTLKVEASNALLKTLEEPPADSILILVTHSPEMLLPTIKSRTQGVQFFNLKEDVIMDLLEKKMGFSDKDAKKYSELSMGSVSRALSMSDENIFNQRKSILDMLADGTLHTMKNTMDKIDETQDALEQFKEELIKQMNKPENGEIDSQQSAKEPLEDEDAFVAGEYKRRVEDILGLILSWYRDILVYKNLHGAGLSDVALEKSETILNKDYTDRIKYWSDRLGSDDLFNRIKTVEDVKEALNRQVNLKLLLQVMFVQLNLV